MEINAKSKEIIDIENEVEEEVQKLFAALDELEAHFAQHAVRLRGHPGPWRDDQTFGLCLP